MRIAFAVTLSLEQRQALERLFRDLTENCLHRGAFRSVELITAIFDDVSHPSDNPKPFIWTAKAAGMLEKVKRTRSALHNRQSVYARH